MATSASEWIPPQLRSLGSCLRLPAQGEFPARRRNGRISRLTAAQVAGASRPCALARPRARPSLRQRACLQAVIATLLASRALCRDDEAIQPAFAVPAAARLVHWTGRAGALAEAGWIAIHLRQAYGGQAGTRNVPRDDRRLEDTSMATAGRSPVPLCWPAVRAPDATDNREMRPQKREDRTARAARSGGLGLRRTGPPCNRGGSAAAVELEFLARPHEHGPAVGGRRRELPLLQRLDGQGR